jgi:DNA-binding NtrC family response regulator
MLGRTLPVGILSLDAGDGTLGAETASLKIEEVETAHFRKVINLNNRNQHQTAEAIGCVINNLRNKTNKYGIDVEKYK